MPRTTVSAPHAAAVGLQIRQARVARGLTQTALAERLQVSSAYVSRVEAGQANATVGALARIAAALDAELSFSLTLRERGRASSALAASATG